MGDTGMRDNRRFPRVIREDTLSLTLVDPTNPSTRVVDPIYCSTVDISAAGMQVYITNPLPIRQRVEIWIVLADSLGTFNLEGRVNRLVELDDPDEPEGFLAGIELLDSSPDIRLWRDLF